MDHMKAWFGGTIELQHGRDVEFGCTCCSKHGLRQKMIARDWPRHRPSTPLWAEMEIKSVQCSTQLWIFFCFDYIQAIDDLLQRFGWHCRAL